MNHRSRINILFFRDGRQYAMRFWLAVPPVGSEVMLGSPEKKAHKVIRVVYGVESDEKPDDQCVNVEVEEME